MKTTDIVREIKSIANPKDREDANRLYELLEELQEKVRKEQIENDADIALGYANNDCDAAFQTQKAIRNQKQQ